jgi:hypothetical protein
MEGVEILGCFTRYFFLLGSGSEEGKLGGILLDLCLGTSQVRVLWGGGTGSGFGLIVLHVELQGGYDEKKVSGI